VSKRNYYYNKNVIYLHGGGSSDDRNVPDSEREREREREVMRGVVYYFIFFFMVRGISGDKHVFLNSIIIFM